MSQHTNLISKVLNDSKTVTSKLYIMLKEHLLNLFYSIYEPSLDYSSFDTHKNQIQGMHCVYLRQISLRFVSVNEKYYQRLIKWIKNYLIFDFPLLRISWAVSKNASFPSLYLVSFYQVHIFGSKIWMYWQACI